MRRAAGSLFTTIALNPSSAVPLYRQLSDALRAVILSGQLRAGARLPSTRALAAELGIARSTVVVAFEQLLAEGYLEGKRRGGTYVAHALPDDLLHAPAPTPAPALARGIDAQTEDTRRHALSRRGGAMLTALETRDTWPVASDGGRISPAVPLAFDSVLPALDAFPYEIWQRLMTRRWRQSGRDLLRHWSGLGYQPLREAIATYLGGTRGVRCMPEQVIVLGDGRQALDVTARVLLDPGDAAWIEDPGYLVPSSILAGADVRAIPVPVDAHGLDVDAGMARCATARLAVVTPAPHWPLGMIMPLARRLAVLRWARQTGAWVFENDNDNQYPYIGQPVAALQGLDRDGRVIYYGDFINVLCAALNVGYLVVPPELVDAFAAMQFTRGVYASILVQAVLADFMAEGYFVRHLRRVRRLYAERQAALLNAARQELAGLLEVQPVEAGPYVIGWLPEGVDDRAAARHAAQRDITVLPLSAYGSAPLARNGLLLGYAAVATQEMPSAVGQLALALRETMREAMQETTERGTGLVWSGPSAAPAPSVPSVESHAPQRTPSETGGIAYRLNVDRPVSPVLPVPPVPLATVQTYLTTVQAAREFGYSSPSTLRKAMRDGKLRHVRLGPRTVLTTRDWVTAWHAEHDGRGHRRGKASMVDPLVKTPRR